MIVYRGSIMCDKIKDGYRLSTDREVTVHNFNLEDLNLGEIQELEKEIITALEFMPLRRDTYKILGVVEEILESNKQSQSELSEHITKSIDKSDIDAIVDSKIENTLLDCQSEGGSLDTRIERISWKNNKKQLMKVITNVKVIIGILLSIAGGIIYLIT